MSGREHRQRIAATVELVVMWVVILSVVVGLGVLVYFVIRSAAS